MNTYDILGYVVRRWWKHHFPQDVVVFFEQKYPWEDKYRFCSELVECHSDTDYTNMTFLNDFCEGETLAIIHDIVPLTDVLDYYAERKIK